MTGEIALVGAGLGDPELLTVKALRKIQQADVVVYDRLINPAILNSCRADCEKIYVGKMPNYHPVPQDQIEAIMLEKAQDGKNIVRLKSGDPYVFGRGGEEGSTLKDAGIPFEVIPGITSSIGGLAYAGIPVTYRDLAASFHIYTGRLKNAEQPVDWATAAKAEGTLVFLMGMAALEEITQQLIQHGKSADTPAAIIQWASRKQQKTVVGTLATIFDLAKEANLQPPSLIVVGDVVTRRSKLNFFEERPLFSLSIAVPYSKKKKITSRLTDLGAEVVELPKPQLEKYDLTLDFASFDQVVFTDKTSIQVFIETMKQAKTDWRKLSHLKFVTVGHHTGAELRKKGIESDEHLTDINELTSTPETLILGDAQQIASIKKQQLFGQYQVTHEEKIVPPIHDLWQTTDLMYFPNSKAARLFLQALDQEELEILRQRKIIVMGQFTKAVFDAADIPVILTKEPSYESVLEKILEEMN
ncbi:uroporphyrinogen-III C-methyltransferase [Enterococcus sp. 669A]|uniref:uroporphyrinogen-III C-methyltransferase n=1 Tax=Candidatus Enterococcus moelleringii TaxID=2815325 RepID=A0ABS3LEE2_9ENTE|nr:uroporphyrinogen-III C-methyltransferase [Enterococcus sp. 669A]MBO1308002.1 uroporphyrinogen-III C-methyltransferase [Enterococcus sp. 669A]